MLLWYRQCYVTDIVNIFNFYITNVINNVLQLSVDLIWFFSPTILQFLSIILFKAWIIHFTPHHGIKLS